MYVGFIEGPNKVLYVRLIRYIMNWIIPQLAVKVKYLLWKVSRLVFVQPWRTSRDRFLKLSRNTDGMRRSASQQLHSSPQLSDHLCSERCVPNVLRSSLICSAVRFLFRAPDKTTEGGKKHTPHTFNKNLHERHHGKTQHSYYMTETHTHISFSCKTTSCFPNSRFCLWTRLRETWRTNAVTSHKPELTGLKTSRPALNINGLYRLLTIALLPLYFQTK